MYKLILFFEEPKDVKNDTIDRIFKLVSEDKTSGKLDNMFYKVGIEQRDEFGADQDLAMIQFLMQ